MLVLFTHTLIYFNSANLCIVPMLAVKVMKESFDFLLIGLLDRIVGYILVSQSYFDLSSMVIDTTSNPNHMVRELGIFGEFVDEK